MHDERREKESHQHGRGGGDPVPDDVPRDMTEAKRQKLNSENASSAANRRILVQRRRHE
jgi:hypothetical protein